MPTRDELIENGIHPIIVDKYLKKPNGEYRLPYRDEWVEDFGLGYANRLAYENDSKEISKKKD